MVRLSRNDHMGIESQRVEKCRRCSPGDIMFRYQRMIIVRLAFEVMSFRLKATRACHFKIPHSKERNCRLINLSVCIQSPDNARARIQFRMRTIVRHISDVEQVHSLNRLLFKSGTDISKSTPPSGNWARDFDSSKILVWITKHLERLPLHRSD